MIALLRIASHGVKVSTLHREVFRRAERFQSRRLRREAERSGQFYVNTRWLGGTLTNWVTIRRRLQALKRQLGAAPAVVDEARVSEVRAAIAAGSYRIDVQHIADRMLALDSALTR